jgi:hypothetical protein
VDYDLIKFWLVIIGPWFAVILLVFMKQIAECRPTMIRWQITAFKEIYAMVKAII